MIALVRLEAEGKTLKEVSASLDDAAKRMGPAFDHLNVHDEHYERLHETLFKGRRVFKPGKKPAVVVSQTIYPPTTTASSAALYKLT